MKLMEEMKRDWLLILAILALVIFGVVIYPQAPEMVPSHWNLQGQVDDYMRKEFGLFMGPIISLAVFTGMSLLPNIDPKKKNYEKFSGAYRTFRRAIILLLLLLQVVVNLVVLGIPVDIGRLVNLGLGILFIVIGNIMGKVRFNYFIGIRTPWTLASEEVWRKTHRHIAKWWVVAGIVVMGGAFMPGAAKFYFVLIPIIGVAVYSFLYSYLAFQQLNS
jgi:uncharacterized membrane protein